MKRTNLRIPNPFYPAGTEPSFVGCTVFESVEATVLFVEAPNWANAVQWGAGLALEAWTLLATASDRLNSWNPADIEHFFIYRLRPGFPEGVSSLWKESFGHYAPGGRAATLVQRLTPVSGTQLAKDGSPDSLGSVFQRHGITPQALQHYDSQGNLR